MVSFILALVGIFFTISILGIPLAIALFFLALIFAIVALVKKEKARPAWTGLIISLIPLITVTVLSIYTFKTVILPLKSQIIEYGEWIMDDDEMKILITDENFSEYFEDYAENYFQRLLSQLELEDQATSCAFNSTENKVICPQKISILFPSIFQFIVAEMKPMTIASKESWKKIHGITGTISIDPTDNSQNSELNTEEEFSEIMLEDSEILDQRTNTEELEDIEELENVEELDINSTEEENLAL